MGPGRAQKWPKEGRSCSHVTRNRLYIKGLGQWPDSRGGVDTRPCTTLPPPPKDLGATFMSEHPVGAHCMHYDEQVNACCMSEDATMARASLKPGPGRGREEGEPRDRGGGNRRRQTGVRVPP